jgi:hypothetical protein
MITRRETALSAAALLLAAGAAGASVSYVDSFREAFAQEGALLISDLTEGTGPWLANPDTGGVYAYQDSDIQTGLFSVTFDGTVGFRPPQERNNSLAVSQLFVTFDVVGQATLFNWSINALLFNGTVNDGGLFAAFDLAELNGDGVLLTLREWTAGGARPGPVLGIGGPVTLDPGRYVLSIVVNGAAQGDSDAWVSMDALFAEVPAPGAASLLVIAGVAGARRRR